ncbi:MAG: hypothetical protein KatS3mg118_1027 [Paracoccaceae bacterium]|nr:MAG: hypothetical protein KatS3mg118_1027 [Paracoccaceae bacterium]
MLAEVSILDLFIAGILPGLVLAGLFMLHVGRGAALIRPGSASAPQPRTGWPGKLRALGRLMPTVLLIGFIIGSMYAGLASVTEAAAVGVLGAAILAALEGELTPGMLRRALMGAVRTCSMIGLIIAGALFLSKAMARLAIPTEVAAAIEALGLDPLTLIAMLTLFYLLLGCFLDGLSTIVMTLPVTLPLVTAAGFDPVWFGIFLIVTVEMAQITPPIGFNLFVIKALTGDPIGRIARAALPFCLIMLLLVGLLVALPGLATWLPQSMR